MALPPAAPPGPDAGGGMPPPDDAAPAPDQVIVTVCKTADGFMVYAGDEPEESEGGDMSGDDVSAMGAAGGAPSGQPAPSPGAALKMVADILMAAAGGGPTGPAEDAFQSGFRGGPPPPGGMPPGG